MQGKIITISRQYGSGGREIGKLVADKLGIPFYDKEIIAIAAKQSNISDEFFTNPENGNYSFRNFSYTLPLELTIHDKVYLAQYEAIRSIAKKGPCVIVGRGGANALRDTVPLLNVFVYADIEVRKRRAIEEYGDLKNKIEEHIQAIDKKRTSYFKLYEGVDPRQMSNYNICIDSGFTGIENAAEIIKTLYLIDKNKD